MGLFFLFVSSVTREESTLRIINFANNSPFATKTLPFDLFVLFIRGRIGVAKFLRRASHFKPQASHPNPGLHIPNPPIKKMIVFEKTRFRSYLLPFLSFEDEDKTLSIVLHGGLESGVEKNRTVRERSVEATITTSSQQCIEFSDAATPQKEASAQTHQTHNPKKNKGDPRFHTNHFATRSGTRRI